jgi:hypothetical protein
MGQRLRFLICGAQKGGTTALADYLRQHPQLFVPDQKELHFFDDERHSWHKPRYDNYHHHFRSARVDQHWGEATPIYMYWEACAERIWHYNPAMRLVVVLRNPISRAYAHWAMERGRGAEPLSFEEALQREAERCRGALPHQHRVFSYIDRGFYSNQLRRLWRFFGREAVLVLRQEALRQQPQACLDQVCEHLGVAQLPNVRAMESHLGTYPEPMAASCHALLRHLFWHEICQLEALLGWDCRSWLRA